MKGKNRKTKILESENFSVCPNCKSRSYVVLAGKYDYQMRCRRCYYTSKPMAYIVLGDKIAKYGGKLRALGEYPSYVLREMIKGELIDPRAWKLIDDYLKTVLY